MENEDHNYSMYVQPNEVAVPLAEDDPQLVHQIEHRPPVVISVDLNENRQDPSLLHAANEDMEIDNAPEIIKQETLKRALSPRDSSPGARGIDCSVLRSTVL